MPKSKAVASRASNMIRHGQIMFEREPPFEDYARTDLWALVDHLALVVEVLMDDGGEQGLSVPSEGRLEMEVHPGARAIAGER